MPIIHSEVFSALHCGLSRFVTRRCSSKAQIARDSATYLDLCNSLGQIQTIKGQMVWIYLKTFESRRRLARCLTQKHENRICRLPRLTLCHKQRVL